MYKLATPYRSLLGKEDYYFNMGLHRIWTESLPPEELASASVVHLLQKYRLQPLIALPANRQDSDMARALVALKGGQIPIGLWPLLADEEGYWPSAYNAETYARRVWQSLAFAKECDVEIRSVAVDLEPREKLKRNLSRGSARSRLTRLWEERRKTSSEAGARQFARAVRCYSDLAQKLSESGVESLAILIPPVVLDLISGGCGWQKLFGVPVTGPSWTTLSPMIYSSMVRSHLPRGTQRLSHGALAMACNAMKRKQRDVGCCLSLGVVGQGKMKDEVCYSDTRELARDVAIAKRAGIRQFALFSLEGVLNRKHPESWLDALVS